MDNSQILITKDETLNYYVPTEITIPEEDGKYNLAINIQDGQASYVTEESGSSSALPEVTEADNGDVLTVVNGSWNKATPSGGGDIVVKQIGDFAVTCNAGESVALSPTIYIQDESLWTGHKVIDIEIIRRATSVPASALIIEKWKTSLQPFYTIDSSTHNLYPSTFIATNPSSSNVSNVWYDVFLICYKE